MIHYVTGDLFDTPAQTLINTVNTVGVMGKGIALRFKKTFPEMFKEYRAVCERQELGIGSLHLYSTGHKLIVNFPTKKHWRNPSRPEWIRAGLATFVKNYDRMGIHSVAFPPLGCGNGELSFSEVVRPIMDEYLKGLPIPVYIYAPHPPTGPPEHREPKKTAEWLRSQPRDLAFSEVWRDIRRVLQRGSSFETLAQRAVYEAAFEPSRNEIHIVRAGKTITISMDEFYDYWIELREYGYLARGSLPAHRDRDASYILPILAALPYVQVVRSSLGYETFQSNPGLALQIVAAEMPLADASSQLELV